MIDSAVIKNAIISHTYFSILKLKLAREREKKKEIFACFDLKLFSFVQKWSLHRHSHIRHTHTPAATIHSTGPPPRDKNKHSPFLLRGRKSHGSDWLKSSTTEHTPKCVSAQAATVKYSDRHSLAHGELPGLEWVKVYSLCIIRSYSIWKTTQGPAILFQDAFFF